MVKKKTMEKSFISVITVMTIGTHHSQHHHYHYDYFNGQCLPPCPYLKILQPYWIMRLFLCWKHSA